MKSPTRHIRIPSGLASSLAGVVFLSATVGASAQAPFY